MSEFASRMKEHLIARYQELLAGAKQKLAEGKPAAAFGDVWEAEQIAGDNEDLAELWKELRAAFTRDPSKIAHVGQARWFYNPLAYWEVVRKGLSRGDVFEGIFQIHQRFDHHYYRAEYGGSRGVEVVIYSPTALPHGNPSAVIQALVRVKEERKFQRAFGTTAVLPVVEVLFRTL